MKDFSIETQWKLYLQKVGVRESEMHAVQKQETKRAFYGCAGELLILFRDGLTELADKEGDDAAAIQMQKMMDEVLAFWKNQK